MWLYFLSGNWDAMKHWSMALKAGLWKNTFRTIYSYGSENIHRGDKAYDFQRIYKSSKLADDQSGKMLVQGYNLKMKIVLHHTGWITNLWPAEKQRGCPPSTWSNAVGEKDKTSNFWSKSAQSHRQAWYWSILSLCKAAVFQRKQLLMFLLLSGFADSRWESPCASQRKVVNGKEGAGGRAASTLTLVWTPTLLPSTKVRT